MDSKRLPHFGCGAGRAARRALRTALRLAMIACFIVLLTAVPQTLAALSDGPISDEHQTVRSVKRLFFLDRTISGRFILATPKKADRLVGERTRAPTEWLYQPLHASHLDMRAPLPRIVWLMRLTTINLLHNSNFT